MAVLVTNYHIFVSAMGWEAILEEKIFWGDIYVIQASELHGC